MKIVYLVSSGDYFGSMSSEREYLVKLLGLSAGGWMRAYE